MKGILSLLIFSVFLIGLGHAQRYQGNNNDEDRNNYIRNQVGGQSGFENQGNRRNEGNRGNSQGNQGHRGDTQGSSQGNNVGGQQQPSIEQLKQSLTELQEILQHENDGTRFGGSGGFLSTMTAAGRGFCSLLTAFSGRGNGYGSGYGNGFGSGIGSVVGGGHGSTWGGGRRPYGQGGYGQGGYGQSGYGEYTGYDRSSENNKSDGNDKPPAFGNGQSSSIRRPVYGYNDDGQKG